MCNKHEVLMLKSIQTAFENIWCSYFSFQQGSEVLIPHFHLYLFFTEFVKAFIFLVHSSLPCFFHCVANSCTWIEPFLVIGWTALAVCPFLAQSSGSCACLLVWRLPKTHLSTTLLFYSHFGLCHSPVDTGTTNLLQNH